MRRTATALPVPENAPAGAVRSDWQTLHKLLPYLWRYRVGVALAFLLAAKVANVGVPLLLKHLVDALDLKPGDARAVLVVPVGLLLAYGLAFPQRKLMLLFPPIPMPAWLFVTLYGLLELYLGVSGSGQGVAHFAHLGGMAAGALLLVYWSRTRRLL